MPTIEIDPRFRGFPDIALGGYVGGVLAQGRSNSEVVLRRPVKVGTPYEMIPNSDGTISLRKENDLLASVSESSLDIEPPEPVGFEESKVAAEGYVGFRKHFVPFCFNCGPLRKEGDGLRIFPGTLASRDDDVVAAPWIPAENLGDTTGAVKSEFVWSALDCPTMWALILQGQSDSKEMAVTARLAVKVISPMRVCRPYVVMGWKITENERNKVSGGAIYSADGQLHALARHTLATTNWGVPMGLNSWR